MILPGHVAAPVLASRLLALERKLAIAAGVAPDLIDKCAYYGLHITRWSRLPAHSPLIFVLSTLAVGLAGRLRCGNWRWGWAWFAGYGLHLLCDLIPPEGILPLAWPLRSYSEMVSSGRPWFLRGGPVPWPSVIAEVALVLAATVVELSARRRAQRAGSH